LPEEVDEEQERKLLEDVFGQWLGDDVASWFADFLGYMLFIAPNKQNLWADFFGVGSNGKSCCLHLIEEILGDDKINGCDLKYIGRFSGDAFKNKWLIIGRDSANVVSEGAASFIKAFTGERKLHIEKKGGAEYDADNMGKLIVSTNYLIQSKDRSFGWYRRIVPIPFTRKFPLKPSFEDDLLSKAPEIARILLQRAFLSRKNKAILMNCAPKPVNALRSETRMLNDRIAAFWELNFHKEEEVDVIIEHKGKQKKQKEIQRSLDYNKLLALHEKTISQVYAEYAFWHEAEFGETNLEPSLKVFGGPYGAFLQSDAGDYFDYKHTRDGRKICLKESREIEVRKEAAEQSRYQEPEPEQEEVF
jgi:phage/plasmid-associated DNA primase